MLLADAGCPVATWCWRGKGWPPIARLADIRCVHSTQQAVSGSQSICWHRASSAGLVPAETTAGQSLVRARGLLLHSPSRGHFQHLHCSAQRINASSSCTATPLTAKIQAGVSQSAAAGSTAHVNCACLSKVFYISSWARSSRHSRSHPSSYR